MATATLDDELWKLIEPLLPVRKRRLHHPGRKRIDDRCTLAGILFVLRTGIAWQQLPQELGYGSGMTCWRRLQEWQQAGVFQALHERLLSQLRAAGRLDLSRAVCDSASLRALLGAIKPGPVRLTGATRQQAPPDHRRQRHTARLPAHRGQRT